MAGVNWIYNSRIIRDDDGTGANNPVDVPLRFNVVATFFFFQSSVFFLLLKFQLPVSLRPPPRRALPLIFHNRFELSSSHHIIPAAGNSTEAVGGCRVQSSQWRPIDGADHPRNSTLFRPLSHGNNRMESCADVGFICLN